MEISKVTLTIEKQPIFLFSHILCCFVFISFVYVLFFCFPFPFSMASVPRGSNKPVSNVNQRFDNLTDNRVKLAAKLKVQSPAVKDILSFMGREPPVEVQMLDQDGKEKMSAAEFWKSCMQLCGIPNSSQVTQPNEPLW